MTCVVCDTAVVRGGGKPPHDIDVTATCAALESRVADGSMRLLRADVPLDDMLALAISELRYTVVSFLHCAECGRTRFWGLCIRGAPAYSVVDADAPSRWRWDKVPPRESWAST